MTEPIPEYKIPGDCDAPIDPPMYLRAPITQGQYICLVDKIRKARKILASSRNAGTTPKERNVAALEAENILSEAMEVIHGEKKI